MKLGRQTSALNLAFFISILGFILLTFGLLMYWSDDKETYGTSFVSTGSSLVITAIVIAIWTTSRRRFQPTHIIDNPRISYIYSQQYVDYSARTGAIQLPIHSRDSSLNSEDIPLPSLQVFNSSSDVRVVINQSTTSVI